MTAYQVALGLIDKYSYKRGAHIGDAPADPGNRRKTQFRLRPPTAACASACVRFHRTDILELGENGDITLNARGWADSSTTKQAFGDALGVLKVWNISRPYSEVFRGARHTVITAVGGTYVYYDGMRFSQEGVLRTAPARFSEYRIDREETAELAKELVDSGFKALFPVLFATCTPDRKNPMTHMGGQQLRDKLTSADRACDWSEIVAVYKYPRQGWWSNHTEAGSASACWSKLMSELKRSMYSTNVTDTTVIKQTPIPSASPATAV